MCCGFFFICLSFDHFSPKWFGQGVGVRLAMNKNYKWKAEIMEIYLTTSYLQLEWAVTRRYCVYSKYILMFSVNTRKFRGIHGCVCVGMRVSATMSSPVKFRCTLTKADSRWALKFIQIAATADSRTCTAHIYFTQSEDDNADYTIKMYCAVHSLRKGIMYLCVCSAVHVTITPSNTYTNAYKLKSHGIYSANSTNESEHRVE